MEFIPSYNKKINYYFLINKPRNFDVIGSAHNIKEILIKERQGCKEMFISSILKFKNLRNF